MTKPSLSYCPPLSETHGGSAPSGLLEASGDAQVLPYRARRRSRILARCAALCLLAVPLILRGLVGCAGYFLITGAARPASVGCDDCGTVRGSITVELATVRADGPKNDLDVVVVLKRIGGPDPPPATATASMDQRGLVFIPHVLAIERGTTVTFLNNDNDEHNIYFLNDRTGETLDIGTWGQGVSVDHTFSEAGTIITLCKLHLEMAAYIVVVESPWFVQVALDASSRRGEFAIEDVPPGEYELTVWHKKLKQKGGGATLSLDSGESVAVDTIITKSKYAKTAN